VKPKTLFTNNVILRLSTYDHVITCFSFVTAPSRPVPFWQMYYIECGNINICLDHTCCAMDHAFTRTCSFSSRFEQCNDGWTVMAMPDSGFQSNFSNGYVNAVFNYAVSINSPKCRKIVWIMSELVFFYNFKQTCGM